jgi:hypothetical protein
VTSLAIIDFALFLKLILSLSMMIVMTILSQHKHYKNDLMQKECVASKSIPLPKTKHFFIEAIFEILMSSHQTV